VPDPHPPSRPLPPPPREDRQQKPATPPTGAASHQQPSSAAPQPQQRNSHIFKPMVRSLCIQYCFLIVCLTLLGTWKQPDKWTALCHFPCNNKKGNHSHAEVMFCMVCIRKIHLYCTAFSCHPAHEIISKRVLLSSHIWPCLFIVIDSVSLDFFELSATCRPLWMLVLNCNLSL